MPSPVVESRWSRLAASLDRAGAVMGLQMAIAVVAALFFALLLRLEYPTWSVFTVLMLLLAQYVGAVQQKAVFRMAGTVLGGLLGYLATGALQQDPWLYLSITFVVIAFSVAMFGQSRAPYAFFLLGLTYVVIVSNSQTDPSLAWKFALLRIEEVGLGVVVSMVVQSTVFPNYANRAFREALQVAFEELRVATPLAVAHFERCHTEAMRNLNDFPSRATALRTLLRFGGMESKAFRKEIGRSAELVTKVTRAAGILRSFQRYEPAPEPYQSALRELVGEAGILLAEGWKDLQGGEGLAETWKNRASSLNERIEDTLRSLRGSKEAWSIAPEECMGLSAHLLAISELREALLEMDSVERAPAGVTSLAESLDLAPAWPGPEWINRGIRSGLACVVALILENWLKLPNGAMMLLCVYVFTVLNAQSPDETGDRSAIRYTIVFGIATTAICIALLAATPLMASYAVQNIVLATWAFLFGYWLHGAGGVTVPLSASFFLLISVLGLNSQVPVAFSDIEGVFSGIILGFVLAALAQRLFWPVLPQQNLQRGMRAYLRTLSDSLERGMSALPLGRRTAQGLFPSKALKFVAAMAGPCFPQEEAGRMREFILTMQDLASELDLCARHHNPFLPPDVEADTTHAIEETKAVVQKGFELLDTAFRDASCPADLTPEIDAALALWDASYASLHSFIWKTDLSPAEAISLLGLGARFRATLLILKQAIQQARSLRMDGYLGDISL